MGRCGGRLFCLPRFNLRALCSRLLSASLADDSDANDKREAARAIVVFILTLNLSLCFVIYFRCYLILEFNSPSAFFRLWPSHSILWLLCQSINATN